MLFAECVLIQIQSSTERLRYFCICQNLKTLDEVLDDIYPSYPLPTLPIFAKFRNSAKPELTGHVIIIAEKIFNFHTVLFSKLRSTGALYAVYSK